MEEITTFAFAKALRAGRVVAANDATLATSSFGSFTSSSILISRPLATTLYTLIPKAKKHRFRGLGMLLLSPPAPLHSLHIHLAAYHQHRHNFTTLLYNSLLFSFT